MILTYGSVCSGIEAASCAWEPLGHIPFWFSEIDDFPCKVLAHHWPKVPNLGDMTTLAPRIARGEVQAPQVFVGGTPCFTAGHFVLTEHGYRPIEDLKPNDYVVTHTGQLKRIARIGSKLADVGKLNAVGQRDGIICTPDHPFRAVSHKASYRGKGEDYRREVAIGEPEWRKASEMKGHQWCALTTFDVAAPSIESRLFTDEQAMYMAGAYIGDGYIRRWTDLNKKAVIFGINNAKLSRFHEVIPEGTFSVSKESRGSIKASIFDTAFADWLVSHFGELSHSKRIPAWVMSHPLRQAFFDGYCDTDGSHKGNGKLTINSVSFSLAWGVAALAQTLGYVAGVSKTIVAKQKMIEGRTVNQRDYWAVDIVPQTISRKSRQAHGMLLRAAGGFEPEGQQTVYNIEVEDDHSYILNGAIVHNCQGFSLAGLRESLEDERSVLALEYIRIANAIDDIHEEENRPPAIIVWENVPGVLNTKDNAFGNFLAGLAGDDTAYEPSGKSWSNAGVIYGPQRVVAWRVLDGQFFGVAQQRRRVFVIASARNDFDPAAVLFECQSVRRNTPPSREAQKAIAAAVRSGIDDGRGQTAVKGYRLQAFGQYADDDIASTIQARDYKDVTDLIVEPQTFPANMSGTQFAAAPGDVCQTLQAKNPTAVAYSVALRGRDGGTMAELGDDVAPALRSAEGGGCKNYVLAFAENTRAEVRYVGGDGQIVGPLTAGGGKAGQGYPAVLDVPEMVVRRLLPTECEALQGFPRNFTFIPVGKFKRMTPDELAYARLQRPDLPDYDLQCMAKDGSRYKALGNSMAVPVMRWLMEQITAALDSTCKDGLQVPSVSETKPKMTKPKKALAAPAAPEYVRPFLKWPGGKYAQLDTILPLLGTSRRLIEPFGGAGSVFLNAKGFDSYVLADNNRDLMLLWDAIKLAPDLLMARAREMFEKEKGGEGFKFVRQTFNENGYIKIQRAAAFLYLNRHAFNGLMRYNLSGEFNTSYGNYKKPYFPEDELRHAMAIDKPHDFFCQSFVDTCRMAGEGDVLFCDPPYMPMPNTEGFTSYTAEPFNEERHWQLLNEMVQAHQRGARVVVTNSSAPAIVEAYTKAGFTLKTMHARRSMSCKGDKRGIAADIIGVLE